MARATAILATTTVLGIATSLWLYLDNRSLRSDLDDATAKPAAAPVVAEPKVAAPDPDPWNDAVRKNRDAKVAINATPQPSLPADTRESRMDRRARRTEEFAAMFGRGEGETEEEYRARIVPLIKVGLAGPRDRVAEMRKIAEEKAHVTPEQSAKLDKAFTKVYDDVLTYTNKAIQDGQLSPYERNVAGWLDFAGGLGGILTDAQGQVGKILDPGQMKTMYDAGFEWGEYLGATAPWENLKAPPPHKP
jgi:hypothetical protein